MDPGKREAPIHESRTTGSPNVGDTSAGRRTRKNYEFRWSIRQSPAAPYPVNALSLMIWKISGKKVVVGAAGAGG